MKLLVPALQAETLNCAYLLDRTHAPQRYGAQGRWEPRAAKAPVKLEERRAQIPMAEYQTMHSERREQFGR